MTESAMMAKDSIFPKKHMCAQSPFLAVIGSIQSKNRLVRAKLAD